VATGGARTGPGKQLNRSKNDYRKDGKLSTWKGQRFLGRHSHLTKNTIENEKYQRGRGVLNGMSKKDDRDHFYIDSSDGVCLG